MEIRTRTGFEARPSEDSLSLWTRFQMHFVPQGPQGTFLRALESEGICVHGNQPPAEPGVPVSFRKDLPLSSGVPAPQALLGWVSGA